MCLHISQCLINSMMDNNLNFIDQKENYLTNGRGGGG